MITDDFNIILKQGMKCTLQKEVISDDIQICRFNLQWDDINYRDNDAFEIIWEVPMIDISYTWSPMNGNCHSVLPNWSKLSDQESHRSGSDKRTAPPYVCDHREEFL